MDNEALKQLREDVADIKRAVIGDERYDQCGLVHRVSSLERWRDSMTVRIAVITGGATVVVWILNKLL